MTSGPDPAVPGPAAPGPAGTGPASPEPADLGFADPVSAAASLSATVAAATAELRRTAAGLSADQVSQPSGLPGWSRGHLLTHLARNADSLRNLLIWARTGVETPQYRSQDEREEGIVAGAGRTVPELLADLDASAAVLASEADSLAPADWAVGVASVRGAVHPAWYTLWRRLMEVEIHHVDLDAGYGPADWPEPFAVTCLDRVALDFDRPDAPAALLISPEPGHTVRIGPAGRGPEAEISGPVRPMLAWLTGRGPGAGLMAGPAGPLPALPPW